MIRQPYRCYRLPQLSATYSPNNVPYHPKKYLTANIGGLKDNDFVFVLGYPGGTTRYRESWSMQYARDANFPFLYKWLRAMSETLKQIGSTDEEKRIAFQGDIANFDNSRKLYEGGYLRLERSQVVQQRQAEEARLAAWIAADPHRQKKSEFGAAPTRRAQTRGGLPQVSVLAAAKPAAARRAS